MAAAHDRAAMLALPARRPALYGLLTRTDGDQEIAEVIVLNRRI